MFDEDLTSVYWQKNFMPQNPLDYRNMWVGEKRDDAYLWEMYPKDCKILRIMAQEMLDLEDYCGSFIYDEYPDKFLFLRLVNKITEKYMKEVYNQHRSKETHRQQKMMDTDNPHGMEDMNRYYEMKDMDGKERKRIQDIVQIILANEIDRRRKQRKFW